MCTKHDKLLQLFCKADEMCVFILCIVLNNKTRDVVSMKEKYEAKKTKLEKTEVEVYQMIPKRRLKIHRIKCSVKLSKQNADREIAEGVQVFNNLIQKETQNSRNSAEGFTKTWNKKSLS